MFRLTRIFRSIKHVLLGKFAAMFGANVHDQMWTWFN